MLLEKERVAICFSGEPRALSYTHENIRNFLDSNFGNYDIFGYIPFCTTSMQLEKYFPEAIIKMEMDQHIEDHQIPNANRFPPHSGKQAYLQQINGWKQSNQMRKDKELAKGFKYDYVIRCRMDVKYTTPMPTMEVEEGRLYIPNFHHHGGINDRFCMADRNPSICTHAETFLLGCLRQQNSFVQLIDLKFNRVRENGDECHWDSTDP